MRRIEGMAVGWGGLVAAIGLLAAAERDTVPRAIIIAVTFTLGGFLAGIRADEVRLLHGALAAIAAYAFYALFVLVGRLVDVAGGPDAPAFAPGDDTVWLATGLLGIACSVAGALVAAIRLRPARVDRRRRAA